MFLDGNGSSFLFDNVDRPMLGNPRHSWILDFTPLIPDSRYWIPVSVSGTWILDSKCDLVRFRILELHSGFRGPGFRIPKAKISRIPDSTSKNFPDSRNQMPRLHAVRLRKALNSALHETRD